jgi:hypothetical protein
VDITNPTSWYIGQIWRIKLLYSPTGEYNKTEIWKMAASRFVDVTREFKLRVTRQTANARQRKILRYQVKE